MRTRLPQRGLNSSIECESVLYIFRTKSCTHPRLEKLGRPMSIAFAFNQLQDAGYLRKRVHPWSSPSHCNSPGHLIKVMMSRGSLRSKSLRRECQVATLQLVDFSRMAIAFVPRLSSQQKLSKLWFLHPHTYIERIVPSLQNG